MLSRSVTLANDGKWEQAVMEMYSGGEGCKEDVLQEEVNQEVRRKV